MAGLLLSLGGAWWLWRLESNDSQQAIEARTQVTVHSLERALSDATIRLASISGLYQASQDVTELEFRRFVKKLGLLPGMDAIGYMPLVVDRNLASHESAMRAAHPGYAVFDISESGERIPPGDRRVHVPLQWHEPIEAFDRVDGFDSMSDPSRAAALELARVSRDLAVSPFLRLLSEDDGDGFVMYWPVTDAETDALTGYATAAMDLGDLVDGIVSEVYQPQMRWEVIDVTDQPGSGSADGAGDGLLDVGGRTWELVIIPTASSDMVPNPRSSLLLLATGLIATVFVTGALETRRRNQVARQQFDKLRELTIAKDQFLASVGHELRTPLTSVLGFAELLRSDHPDISDEERMGMIASVADEATDLASIVDDLLVAARSELDLLVVTQVPVSARAQVAQVLEIAGKDAGEAIQVVADADNPYRAIGDPGRVRQILRNLITNACRYGGDQIEVRLGGSGPWVSVVVADDGDGVPDEDAGHIFDPYYRAHSSESQPAALGIGLSVARQLAILMNGDLAYRREDGWTIFELTLPAAIDEKPGVNGHASNGARNASPAKAEVSRT
jgi:signal transduction histidine kinase